MPQGDENISVKAQCCKLTVPDSSVIFNSELAREAKLHFIS